MLFSIAATVLTVTTCSLLLAIKPSITNSFDLKGYLTIFGYFGIMMLYFVFPGWVLSLPAILLIADLRAWRFWALLATGATMGPVTLFFELDWPFRRPKIWIGESDSLLIAFAVSSVSTLIYLSLLRRSQRRKRRSPERLAPSS